MTKRVFVTLVVTLVGFGAQAQFVDSEIDFGSPIDSRIGLPKFDSRPGLILVTGRTSAGDKQLGLYEVKENGAVATTPVVEVSLSDDALFFDTGRVAGRPRLLLLDRVGIIELALTDGQQHEIVRVPSIYRSASKAGLTKLDFLVDVNNDGLDDIVVPDFEGLRVALQTSDGFGTPELLELPSPLVVGQVEARYRVDEVYRYDFGNDGRTDIAVIRNNQFLVFDATGTSSFAHEPRVVPIDIELAGDDVVARLQENIAGFDQSNFRLTRISKIVDLNADGLPDIVTFTAISTGLFDKRSEYRVHFAIRDDRGIRYKPEEDALIPSDGFQVDLATVDVNHDGKLDLVGTSFQLGFTELIAALFSRSLALDIGLHRMSEAGAYARVPDYRAKARLRFSISTGFISNPTVRFADFDGDGVSDLILQKGSEELRIDYGSDRNEGFGSRSATWDTKLPLDGSLIDIVDLNGDGRQDALVGYGRADGEEMLSRLRVLVGTP